MAKDRNKWNDFKTQAYNYYGNPGGINKNPLAIARAIKIAWDAGYKSEEMIKIVDIIINFVKEKN